jgi:hypothetical protein
MKGLVRLPRPHMYAWAVALACAGCGVGKGDVAGKVSFKNKPLVFGTVVIYGEDGLPRYGVIGEDGNYVVKGVPSGPARVTVNSPDPTQPLYSRDDPKGRPRPAEDEKRLAALKTKWFPIAQKYGDVTTSELTLEVRKGTNAYDIDLK